MIDRRSTSFPAAMGAAWLFLTAAIPAVADTADVVLVPHHATYRLSLAKSAGDKAPAAVGGLISYDFSGSACEGYATTFRQVTEMQPAEGDSRVSEMRSATFEDGDAKQFRFNTETTLSGQERDDVDGKASKETGGAVSVDLEKPKPGKSDLKPALFPTEHLRKVIETARSGQKLLTESIYDGSESGTIIYDTLAVIGAPTAAGASEDALQSAEMKALRRWPVSISYFEQGKNDTQPNYVLSFDLYENGVSRALKLDYGSFTLAGDLVDLKLLPVPPCKK